MLAILIRKVSHRIDIVESSLFSAIIALSCVFFNVKGLSLDRLQKNGPLLIPDRGLFPFNQKFQFVIQ